MDGLRTSRRELGVMSHFSVFTFLQYRSRCVPRYTGQLGSDTSTSSSGLEQREDTSTYGGEPPDVLTPTRVWYADFSVVRVTRRLVSTLPNIFDQVMDVRSQC